MITVDVPFIAFFAYSTPDFISLFAGNLINLFLYGVLTVQLYLYYISFPQDPWLLKTIIHLIYLTETGHSILLIYDLGHRLVVSDGGENNDISLVVIPACGGIVAFLTQATYVYRLRVLSQLRYISWSIVALIAVNLVVFIILASITAVYEMPLSGDKFLYIAGGNGYGVAFMTWASVSLLIDTAIAGIMIWSLMRNEILSKQLKYKVIRLVYLIIGTGALTAAVNLVTVILFALESPIALGPTIVLSKLYANSMLVFLNDRIPSGHGRDDHAPSEMMTGALGSMGFATLTGRADTAREQLALEGCNGARGSMSGRTAVPPEKDSCPA